MKRFIAGIAITALMVGLAFAADMPMEAPPPVVAYNWGGFYIGGVIGGGRTNTDSSFRALAGC
jgi:outer membrane immunogenic protein